MYQKHKEHNKKFSYRKLFVQQQQQRQDGRVAIINTKSAADEA